VAAAPPQATTVGRVNVITWSGQAALGAALAEAADHASAFPGIGPLPPRPIRLILAPTRALFDSLTRRRLPPWSDGAAFPDAGVVVLLSERPSLALSGSLRHELAHLALRWRVGRPLPLWFEEGYAATAAGEWGRLDALRLNWQLARGRRMDLDEVDQALRAGDVEARDGYALATTAVLLLQRWGEGNGGLRPLIEQLAAGGGFDAAMRRTYHVTEGEFEERWMADLATHYGWLSWAQSVGAFWAALAVMMVWLALRRRRRDRARRALLDEGWDVPPEDAPTA
jgi:hypothetical protein